MIYGMIILIALMVSTLAIPRPGRGFTLITVVLAVAGFLLHKFFAASVFDLKTGLPGFDIKWISSAMMVVALWLRSRTIFSFIRKA